MMRTSWNHFKRYLSLIDTTQVFIKGYVHLCLILVAECSKDRMTEVEIVQKLEKTAREISSRLGKVEFNFRDPERNFDRSRVKGVVAKLIKVKDSSAVVALEVRFCILDMYFKLTHFMSFSDVISKLLID